MAKPLQALSIAAPGFFGLNTQESGITLESGFALTANNCIIDKYGRLGARKGWRYVTSTGGSGVNLLGAHRFIDIEGTETILSWSATKFYKGTTTLTEITPTSDNTFTEGNWQCVTLNDKAYYFQRGYKPLVYDPVAGTITDVEDASTFHGLNLNGSTQVPPGNAVLSAYGRLWTADIQDPSDNSYYDKMTVYFSDLLDGADWNTGSAGSINLSAILVNGTDEIISMGAQNGQFIVFCKRNIVIFDDIGGSSSFDPANLRLVEVISRVGCVARDSIQNTGIDIFFLSEDGLRSLGRVVQEKSLPMRDLSKNVRDDVVNLTAASNIEQIRSVYSEDNAFYLLLFPHVKEVYCFDTRAPLQDGSLRVTIWDTQNQTNMLSLANSVYFTQTDGLAEYFGYNDNTSEYTFQYFTNYFDFGNSATTKMLKRISATIIGGVDQRFIFKAGFDYTDNYTSYPARLEDLAIAEYGIAEYGANGATSSEDSTPAEYTSGTISDIVRLSGSGTGSILQVGFEANLNGAEISIQKLDAYVKQGRIL
jgi:hypothetical protein